MALNAVQTSCSYSMPLWRTQTRRKRRRWKVRPKERERETETETAIQWNSRTGSDQNHLDGRLLVLSVRI